MKPRRGSPLNAELQSAMAQLGYVLRVTGNLRVAIAGTPEPVAAAQLVVALFERRRELEDAAKRVFAAYGELPVSLAEVG